MCSIQIRKHLINRATALLAKVANPFQIHTPLLSHRRVNKSSHCVCVPIILKMPSFQFLEGAQGYGGPLSRSPAYF